MCSVPFGVTDWLVGFGGTGKPSWYQIYPVLEAGGILSLVQVTPWLELYLAE